MAPAMISPSAAHAAAETAPEQMQTDDDRVDDAVRSPSPSLPAPPVQDTPGPRAQALISAFDKALENTLRRCNYDNFASCFPTPAAYRSETLDMFWREFVSRLERFCKDNFEQLLADRAIVPSLNDLHRLIEDARARKLAAEQHAESNGKEVEAPVPPHTLEPEALLSSHLAPFLSVQHDVIMKQLEEVQRSNADLMGEIQAQRAEMQRMVEGLAGIVADLATSSDMMRADDVQGLSGEVRAIDAELRT